jgi:hypothetical protein
MATPSRDKAALPDPAYHWTTQKALVFLGALADLGRVSEAARAVGMTRQSAYRLRGRLGEGGTFARAWDQAQARGREQRLARRGTARKVTPLTPERDYFGIGR